MDVQDNSDFAVSLAGGYFLKASFGTAPQTLVRNLELVLSAPALAGKTAELEYVDLRFGDRVYYRLKGQDEVSGG